MNNIDQKYNPDLGLTKRFYHHGCFAMKGDLGKNRAPANLCEKIGNGILWTVGNIPRVVNVIGKLARDPRIVTIAVAALALLAVSFIFYPAVTVLYVKPVWIFAINVISKIPFVYVKLAAYILTCTSIVGYGFRAEGRFSNANLMKQFYGLPMDYPGNPSFLSAEEIRALQMAAKAKA